MHEPTETGAPIAETLNRICLSLRLCVVTSTTISRDTGLCLQLRLGFVSPETLDSLVELGNGARQRKGVVCVTLASVQDAWPLCPHVGTCLRNSGPMTPK